MSDPIQLDVRRSANLVPEYSLTGDLLSFETCSKQYRYYNGSSLPPSRPVQLWYGEFIHGVLEQAYRTWVESKPPFPWPYTEISDTDPISPPPEGLALTDLRKLAWPIEQSLRLQNKSARSRRARVSAYKRAHAAINTIGKPLFELINAVEQRLIGTREMPAGANTVRAEHYILTGVIDVLTNVELGTAKGSNPIAEAVRAACPGLDGEFEVIVDYKASRRPPTSKRAWDLGKWQVETYAWLRQRQPGSKRVAAGVLIYLNELSPAANDIIQFRREIKKNETDVVPETGTKDELFLRNAGPYTKNEFSLAFMLRRAIRVIAIELANVDQATKSFDEVVCKIEAAIYEENQAGTISQFWKPTSEEQGVCVACDFKGFCPSQAKDRGHTTFEVVDDEDEPPLDR